jgi:ribonuclease HI
VLVAHFDGACEPRNPGGWATYGYVLHRGPQEVARGLGVVGEGPAMSNNVAEYAAATHALERALDLRSPGEALRMVGDSKLVVEQMKGAWRIQEGRYAPLARSLRAFAAKVEDLTWVHVPRGQNALADALSKQAYAQRLALPRSPLGALLR